MAITTFRDDSLDSGQERPIEDAEVHRLGNGAYPMEGIMKALGRMGTRRSVKAFVLALATLLFVLEPGLAGAAVGYPTSASLQMSDSRPSQTSVAYKFSNTVSSTNAATGIACITLRLTTTTTGTTAPNGLDTTGAAFDNSTSDYLSSWTGWSLDASANGLLKLTKSATSSTPQSSSRFLNFTGITNGDTASTTYFGQFNTYTDNGCTGGNLVDTSTVAFIYVNGQTVTLTVEPSLSFSIAGASSGATCNGATSTVTTTSSTVPLGRLSGAATAVGVQDITVGTNATGGMYVYSWQTQALTSVQNGSNAIDDVGGTNASPVDSATGYASGTEAWGYTTGANDTTGVNLANDRFASDKWAAYLTTANTDHVFYANGIPVDSSTGTGSSGNYAGGQFCVGYEAGTSSITPAGFYTTTVIYNAVPTY